MNNKRKVFFATFLISYVALAVIIVIIYSSVYGSYVNLLKSRTEKYNVLQLEKNISIIDKTMQDISSNLRSIVNSGFIQELHNTGSNISMAQLINLQASFKQRETGSYTGAAQYISMKDKDFIVALDNSSLSRKDYFTNRVKYETITDDEIIKMVESGIKSRYVMPVQNVYISGLKRQVLPIITTLYSGGRAIGYIGTLVDMNYLKAVMKEGFSEGKLMIADESRQVLYLDEGMSQDMDYSYGKMLASGDMVNFAYRSDYNRWTYVLVESKKTVFGVFSDIRMLAFIATVIAIIFALVFGRLFMQKNVMPIGKILDLVEDDKKKSIYDNIYMYMSGLKNNVSEFRRYFERNADFIRGGIVRKLLDGDFKTDEEIAGQCEYTELDFSGKVFWVTVIKSKMSGTQRDVKMKNQELLEALVYSILERHSKYYPAVQFFVSHVNVSTAAVLFCMKTDERENVDKSRNSFERILKKQLNNKVGGEFYILTGQIVEKATDISESYVEVMSLIEKIKNKSESKRALIPSNYWYPLEVESKIVNMAISGECEGISEIIKEIERNNFETGSLNEEDFMVLYYEVKATLVKLMKMNSLEVSEEVISAPDEENPVEAVRYVLKVISEICEQSSKRSKNKDEENYEEIKHFIYKNYWNPDMSLTLISDKFGLNESYISSLFKKYDTSYMSHLERVRLECACKMMLSDKINIAEVAEIVGYNSDQSFRRAFKRLYGISPKSYKELYKDK